MEIHEIAVNAGNAAYKLWEALPEPKLEYTPWYYGKRNQSISEALEGIERVVPCCDNPKLSFGLSSAKWICANCGTHTRDME